MKRLITILIITYFALLATLSAQNITINAVNRDAQEVFAEIMKQSNVNFIYESSVLKGVTVTISAKDQPLDSVLEKLFQSTPITYEIKGRNVLLKRQKSTAPSKKITVSGFVRDAVTKEALSGAVVRDMESGTATATNVYGFYSLNIPKGDSRLLFTYMGYNSQSEQLTGQTTDKTVNMLLAIGNELKEVVIVGSKNNALSVESTSIGSYNLSSETIKNTPAIFGESDIVKTLQFEPGVSAGIEGFAGMYVHGGNHDENLYMLDNIPLYQVNHFGGLFSAFNTDTMRNVDFYKTSFPAKYDGRLSSYVDVHTKDGSLESHHGSVKLGLTSGAFNINGPIKKGTTSYSLAVRRTWYELLTAPILALANSGLEDDDEKTHFQYAFTDINAKVSHHFSNRSQASVMLYYGNDILRGGSKTNNSNATYYSDDDTKMSWGNIVASVDWNYVFSPKIFGDFTAAYTRYKSSMSYMWYDAENLASTGTRTWTRDDVQSRNNIDDWIFRGDFDWRPTASHKVNFGAGYTHHTFLPSRTKREISSSQYATITTRDSANRYQANELNAYIGDDWHINSHWRAYYGLHLSLFGIDGMTHGGIAPRASVRYTPDNRFAFKAAFSRTYQYIHQLTQSYISLPTDQWVPITGDFKPQSSNKYALGAYWLIDNKYAIDVECYYKTMDNLIDYVDEYYLIPAQLRWDSRLTTGKGTAKGVDVKLSKEVGRFTGHLSYSLMWADRTYAERNKGKTYPARFDNRHKINLLLNWRCSDTWDINVGWTGQSGNMFTLSTQVWEYENPITGETDQVKLNSGINNYRLPFYHRLDLGFTKRTKHGYWNFNIYNAYRQKNAISVRQTYRKDRPIYQKLTLFPILPSLSYTWIF